MQVLAIGGAGYVAGLTLPLLKYDFRFTIFDRNVPQQSELRDLPLIQGDVCDLAALAAACEGQEALLYMAMGSADWSSPEALTTAFDVNVKGLYLALEAAHRVGIEHAVYTSSMSVYDGDLTKRYFPDEAITPDALHFYGFTKWLGEEVCRNACRRFGMTINALRLCHPIADRAWQEQTQPGTPTIATAASDVARALKAALEYRGGGFEAFMISGDYEQRFMNMRKARRLLGWEPLARPHPKDPT
ncbi:nucleoside-diphosphate-sugar epimerase [Chthonomonas calidirosea]|uniref:NAD-dependent epimerase/dehydratase family protein n=1 Tax=Chthonomonas calidirosea TaxID=454171 RepID=UPI0006DD45B5|nr:NAD(P)-dependent oxidoreductase [Chthonomonas calidirosea]CEK19173.1 nucleoside-diphosphate-sugar epimerase [Chthonomonas calidirosea]CEK19180.1 nucleoside-diphosphate-sugar epimerase [Chthonomonas calidirosea]